MKSELQPNGVAGQVVIGLLVIAMGLLFLLDNLGILDMHRAVSFWPMLFVIVGVVKLCDTRSRGGTLLGAGLVGVGILMMLDRLGVVSLSWDALWPLALIGLGAYLVGKAWRTRNGPQHGMPADGVAPDDVLDIVAILAGFERRVASQAFRGGEVTTVLGGCTLDMRGASIVGEAVVNVFAFWGGVTIKCPPDWSVELQGTPILGGFEEKTVAPPDRSKRLVIRGYAIMGGVEVRN